MIRNPQLPRASATGRTRTFTFAGLVLAATSQAAAAQICPPERVSVDSNGAQANAPSDWRSVSADGRFVAFDSLAQLDPADQNNDWDSYVHDRLTGITELVGLGSNGQQGNSWTSWPEISADGNVVSFLSPATDLVPNDTNNHWDVFVRDRAAGTTELASVNSNGDQANDLSINQKLSGDGRWVAFRNKATNLDPTDLDGTEDVYLHDRVTGTTSLVSEAVGGGSGNGESGDAGIGLSADGRWVAFGSSAANLVPGGTNGGLEIVLRDTVNGVTTLVTTGAGGTGGNGGSWEPFVSEDGQFIVFYSEASDLVPNDLNGTGDVFLYDRLAGTTELVSLTSDGSQGTGNSGWPSAGQVDRHGRYVVFVSFATNLVAGDTNGERDVFVRDRWTQMTSRLTVGPTGQANAQSNWALLSTDGSTVVFKSDANNLVPGDTNGVPDVFVEGCPGPAGFPFCYGDGGGTACPCANAGAPGEGCANSSGAGGLLEVTGTTSVAADDLVFEASQLLAAQPVLLFVGNDALANGDGIPFGDGLRCVGTSVVRLGIETPGGGGSAGWGPGLGALGGWSAGDTRRFQAWYRDPAGPCSSGFNLTHGLEVVFGP